MQLSVAPLMGGSVSRSRSNTTPSRSHCVFCVCCPLSPHVQPDMGYPGPFLGRANQAAALADLAGRCCSEARALSETGPLARAAAGLADDFERIMAELAQQQQH